MSVKDVQKLAQGLEAQKRAEKAFNRSNFEDALHYYSVAEACYRSAFSTPGDRVFFMQVSSLRCLEQSVEEGRIDFMPQLRDAVTSFFAEWEEKRIRECISLKKQTEAFAFKAWRSLKNIDNRFDKSTAAVNVGDYERARQLLQGIIESLRDSREPEADAQAAIARSKLEIVAVREELTKRVHERDRLRIAEAYQRAAEASVLPPGSRSCQRDRIQAYRFWFRSYENRFRAFTMLEDERRSRDPEEKLSTALDLLDAAVENAQAAVRSAIHNEFPYGDIYNLSYWKAVVEERLELYRFMTSSQGHFFEKACTAWREALKIASSFGGGHFFPNRFYSIQDLNLEETILAAAKAFRGRDWGVCSGLLGQWRKSFPTEYVLSWRYTQVSVRWLMATALLAQSTNNKEELDDIVKEMRNLEKSDPIGNSGRFYIAQAQMLRMMPGAELPPHFVDNLCKQFCLDSVVDAYEANEGEVNFLSSFPIKIKNYIERANTPGCEWEVELFKTWMFAALDALLEYLCDFYGQLYQFGPGAARGDRYQLMHQLIALLEGGEGETSVAVRNLYGLESALKLLEEAHTTHEYSEAYEITRGVLRGIAKIVPVITHLETSTFQIRSGIGCYYSSPDWSKQHLGNERAIWIGLDGPEIPKPGRYYIPPLWRKGDRVFFHVTKGNALFPVTRTPDWEWYEKEATNALWLKVEGVPWSLLEEAIRLAEASVPENGEKPRPAVGALIVKDGVVIGRGTRNQDGNGGHAEELALKSVKLRDVKKIPGSTVVSNAPFTIISIGSTPSPLRSSF